MSAAAPSAALRVLEAARGQPGPPLRARAPRSIRRTATLHDFPTRRAGPD